MLFKFCIEVFNKRMTTRCLVLYVLAVLVAGCAQKEVIDPEILALQKARDRLVKERVVNLGDLSEGKPIEGAFEKDYKAARQIAGERNHAEYYQRALKVFGKEAEIALDFCFLGLERPKQPIPLILSVDQMGKIRSIATSNKVTLDMNCIAMAFMSTITLPEHAFAMFALPLMLEF